MPTFGVMLFVGGEKGEGRESMCVCVCVCVCVVVYEREKKREGG